MLLGVTSTPAQSSKPASCVTYWLEGDTGDWKFLVPLAFSSSEIYWRTAYWYIHACLLAVPQVHNTSTNWLAVTRKHFLPCYKIFDSHHIMCAVYIKDIGVVHMSFNSTYVTRTCKSNTINPFVCMAPFTWKCLITWNKFWLLFYSSH